MYKTLYIIVFYYPFSLNKEVFYIESLIFLA